MIMPNLKQAAKDNLQKIGVSPDKIEDIVGQVPDTASKYTGKTKESIEKAMDSIPDSSGVKDKFSKMMNKFK